MPTPVIKVENLSKRYRIGLKEKRRDTLLGQIGSALRAPLDNFRQLRSLSRFNEDDESVFWALRDINFEVQQGEVLGIIGHNGAGKSTLLKILSRITEPTDGRITVTGRIGALLEVGTGFHPELTGRDNIYMNGTILGMTRREIDRKLDEIVDFSGVENYIDTPVKFYSSGMKVRLGFAVAAHLEPEILIIDEVLSVGDIEFQKKCLNKIEDVATGGRTVLFVSHDMGAIRSLTTYAILLKRGEVYRKGYTTEIIEEYESNYASINEIFPRTGKNILKDISWKASETNNLHLFGKPLKISFICEFEYPPVNAALSFQVLNEKGIPIINPLVTDNQIKWSKKGISKIECIIENPKLFLGKYFLNVFLADKGLHLHLDTIRNIPFIEITMGSYIREYPWAKNSCTYVEETIWRT